MSDSTRWELMRPSLNRVWRGLTWEILRQWAAAGRVLPNDMIAQEGTASWTLVRDVPELREVLEGVAREHRTEPATEPARAQRPSPPAPAAVASQAAVAVRPRAVGRRSVKLTTEDPTDEEIDLAPMIDVTFLLLIFFMITSTLAMTGAVDVPRAKHGVGVSPDGKITVSIASDDGDVLISGESEDRFTLEQLEEQLRRHITESLRATGQSVVIIKAGKDVKHATVARIMDVAAQMGAQKVLIGVEEPSRYATSD